MSVLQYVCMNVAVCVNECVVVCVYEYVMVYEYKCYMYTVCCCNECLNQH